MMEQPPTQQPGLSPLPQGAYGVPATPANWQRPPVNDWQVLGETFETMGKVGLAMTVGFAVAGAFCKLVDGGHIKLPNLASLALSPQPPTPPKA